MQYKTLHINNSIITIKPTPFLGTQSIEQYEKLVYSALHKIGVSSKFISISKPTSSVCTITWEIHSKQFSFTCSVFETYRENIGACTQAIQEDVRHILRGIKDINLVLKQYEFDEKNSSSKSVDTSSLLHYSNPTSSNNSPNNKNNNIHNTKNIENEHDSNTTYSQKIEIVSENHAKSIIQDIKRKYPQFSNYSFIPDNDKFLLEKAYLYLGRTPHWK
ncbi:MAG: hypothetical protein ACLFPL_00565 [Candidatus Nanoarchaeia archaeon]